MKNLPIVWLLCIFVILHSPFYLSAQDVLPDVEPSEDDFYTMSLEDLMNITITTASKSAEKVSEAPATMIVITEQMIKDRGYHHLEEILHDLPGFDFNKNYGVNYSTIFMRGFRSENSDRFILLYDGINENDIWKQTTWISRQYPVSQIKQIEVLYGPASALYGTNAFSGIVNVITKKGDEVGDINLTSTMGSWGRKNFELSSGKTYDNFGYNVTMKYFLQNDLHQWDEYDAINGEDNFSQDHRNKIGSEFVYLVDGKLKKEPLEQALPAENFGIHFNGMIGDLTLTGLVWTKKELEAYFYNPFKRYGKWTQWYETNQGYMLSHKKDLSPKVSLSSNSRVRIHQIIDSQEGGQKYYTSPVTDITSIDYAHSQTIRQNDPTSYQLKPIEVILENGDTSYVSNVIYHYRLNTRDMMLEEQLNYTAIEDKLSFIFGGKLTYTNTQEDYESAELIKDIKATPRHLRKTYAAYAQSTIKPTEAFRLTLGLRFEDQKDEDGVGYHIFVPRVSAVYKLKDNIVFRLLYSQAFQDADDWHKFATDFDLRPANSANLEPEKLSSFELGSTINLNNKVLFSASGYYVVVSNFIEEVANTVANPYHGYTYGLHYANTTDGEMKIYGYEINANANFSEFFSLNGNISGSFNYGPAARRELDASGNYQNVLDASNNPIIDDEVLIGDMAPIKFNLGFLFKIKDRISVYPKVNYVATKKTINWQQNPSTDPIFREIEGYAIIGLNINLLNMVGAVKGLDFNLNIDNLTNSEYFNPGSRSADGIKYTSRVLQPGFNVMAGIKYSF